jgi:hypothetical protein
MRGDGLCDVEVTAIFEASHKAYDKGVARCSGPETFCVHILNLSRSAQKEDGGGYAKSKRERERERVRLKSAVHGC